LLQLIKGVLTKSVILTAFLSPLYRVTQKTGNFWKTQQKLKKSKKKNYWPKLNHYNLPF